MIRRLWNALLLKGVWKFKPIHAVTVWVFLIYNGWMGSPYFMYYVVGAPQPGTAPRYVGTIKTEGELQRTRDRWIPPRYVIQTSKGDVEFHCHFRPDPFKCIHDDVYRETANEIYEIGYDAYWVTCPPVAVPA